MLTFNNKPQWKQSGFTLIELLVAIGLGALLIFGVFKVFESSREGTKVQLAMTNVQDSGRIAMEFITHDVRNADFSGCLKDKTRIQNLLDTSATGYNASVHDYYALGGITGVESASSLTIDTLAVVDGTSTVSVVGAMPACDGMTAIDSSVVDEDSDLTMRGTCPIEPGTVLLVADCYFGDIFVKTNASTATTIAHSTATVNDLANTSTSFQNTYRGDAQVLVPFVRQYFVAPGSNGNNSLYRREDGVNQELVMNVVDFQVTYGQDSDDDGAADQFAGTFADMSLVVSARVSLTVRSIEEIEGAPLTRTYTSTASIRNRTTDSEAAP